MKKVQQQPQHQHERVRTLILRGIVELPFVSVSTCSQLCIVNHEERMLYEATH